MNSHKCFYNSEGTCEFLHEPSENVNVINDISDKSEANEQIIILINQNEQKEKNIKNLELEIIKFNKTLDNKIMETNREKGEVIKNFETKINILNEQKEELIENHKLKITQINDIHDIDKRVSVEKASKNRKADYKNSNKDSINTRYNQKQIIIVFPRLTIYALSE